MTRSSETRIDTMASTMARQEPSAIDAAKRNRRMNTLRSSADETVRAEAAAPSFDLRPGEKVTDQYEGWPHGTAPLTSDPHLLT